MRTASLHARLCTGLAALESAQPAYELWDLSRLVLASDALRQAFEPADGAEIERRLAALSGARSRRAFASGCTSSSRTTAIAA